jgi:hypothetical protein
MAVPCFFLFFRPGRHTWSTSSSSSSPSSSLTSSKIVFPPSLRKGCMFSHDHVYGKKWTRPKLTSQTMRGLNKNNFDSARFDSTLSQVPGVEASSLAREVWELCNKGAGDLKRRWAHAIQSAWANPPSAPTLVVFICMIARGVSPSHCFARLAFSLVGFFFKK